VTFGLISIQFVYFCANITSYVLNEINKRRKQDKNELGGYESSDIEDDRLFLSNSMGLLRKNKANLIAPKKYGD
jgi:hypothetical protein